MKENINTSYAIGIDIGGTNTDIGLVTADGTCLLRRNLPTGDYSDPEKYADDIVRKIHILLDTNNLAVANIVGIGIGAPNGNFHSGCIEYAANLHFDGIVPLVELIRQRISTKVALTNDANAAALGERVYGGAKGLDDFIVVTLGTGVGSGLVANGKLVYGHDGFGGELGHTILYPEGRACNCGRAGCLETYTSIRGIIQTYKELGGQGAPTNTKFICDEADKGNPIAIQTWERTAHYLGIGLANAATMMSPKVIFLMGGIVNAKHWFMEPLKVEFEKNLLSFQRGKISIEISHLKANDSAILGAAALVAEI